MSLRESMIKNCRTKSCQWGAATFCSFLIGSNLITFGLSENGFLKTLIVLIGSIIAFLSVFFLWFFLWQVHGVWIWTFHRKENGEKIAPHLQGWRGWIASFVGKFD